MASHISKSKYLNGLQCPKLLWAQLNARDLIPDPSPSQQHIFDTGHLVGDLAKLLYPTGIEIPMDYANLAATHTATTELMGRPRAERVPIFEASFLVEGRYCRVDVLVPAPDGSDQWDLIEVKSSTRVKDVNVNDVAFQRDTLTRAGVNLQHLYLMHVNTGYVREDTFAVDHFFVLEDITARAESLLEYIPRAVEKMHSVIAGPDPDTPIGKRCTSPYACPLISTCWAALPENNVTDFYYSGARAFKWLDEGLFNLVDVPDERLGHQQKIQKQTVISGQAHTDPEKLRGWLDELNYPLYHLDFETMNPAVPPFAGVRPYQRIPFQFSLHIQETPGAQPKHVEFLAREAGDPRTALVTALRAIGAEGTVLAWNMGFEKGVLSDLSELYPAEAEWLSELVERMVDLMVPFRSFWYHDPAQKGSCSLKAVLPALTSLGYEDLTVAEGNHAAQAYVKVVYGEVTAEEKENVFEQLLAYCGIDTLAMVEILRVVEAAAQPGG